MDRPKWTLGAPLWSLKRVTRVTRETLGSVAIDADFLRCCATQYHLLVIAGCDARHATTLLSQAGERVTTGIIWIVTATDSLYTVVRRTADDAYPDRLMFDAHAQFRRPAPEWKRPDGRAHTVLLTDTATLRSPARWSPRKRDDILELPPVLLAVVDPSVALCRRKGEWDPAWIVRDIEARLAARHGPIALAAFVNCAPEALAPEVLISAYGKHGAFFFDGSA